ncbi:hypothetical protein LCGC14_0725730 [marine sediment metagenome]|uniref:Uncharacterized protein n=1 Tax=marine sediment metagenome TaxID=412755 RepID=A0A0F9QW15_9ZZZZ
MLFAGKDGELRVQDQGLSGTSYYLSLLFTEMDFSGPTSRPRTDETLMMNRGNFSTDSHYIESNDDPRLAPIPVTFSCRINDTENSRIISDWFSGVTIMAGSTQIYSCKGKTAIDSITLPDFKDSGKQAYYVEVLWDGTTDYGLKYNEIYFTPGEQTITESADSLMMSINGQVYGDVTRIAAFTSGFTSII